MFCAGIWGVCDGSAAIASGTGLPGTVLPPPLPLPLPPPPVRIGAPHAGHASLSGGASLPHEAHVAIALEGAPPPR